MAEFEDINQNINLKYTTNADDTAKEIIKLDDAQESVTRSTQANTKATKENTESQKSFKAQIREATQDLLKVSQQYGETSKEAVEAAKKVAQLKDQMGFANDLVDKFNPDQKFKALGAATQVAATGVSGVVSGMALFGDQSEDTQKTLLKVQAAMSFSDAISNLSNLGDQYKTFKATVVAAFTSLTASKVADTVATETQVVVENQSTASKIKGAVATGAMTVATNIATAAQWFWNAAVMSNPIVALVVAIAAATAGIYLFTKMLIDSSAANEKAGKDTEKLSKYLDAQSMSLKRTGDAIRSKNEQTLAMAKANGASSESIRKLEKKLLDEQIAVDKASATTASNTFIQERNSLAKLKAAGASDEVIKAREKEVNAAYDTFKRENKQLDESYKARAQQSKDFEVQIAEEKFKAKEEVEEKEKEHLKKLQDERNKAAEEARKKREEDYKKQLAEKAAFDKAVNDADTNQYFLAQEQRVEDAQNQLEWQKEFSDLTTEIANKEAEDKLNIEKAVAEQKQAIQEAQTNLADKAVGFLSAIAGKNKALQKAAIIAENAVGIGKMIIANNAANIGALATPQAIATSGASAAPVIAANNISTGLGVATTIAATAKALSALGGGGSAGGGGGQSASSPSASGTPSVGFQNSTENQIANQVTNGINTQEPVKAFVVSQEVTTAQSLDRNKIEANSI